MDDFNFTGEESCTEEQWKEFFKHPCWIEYLDSIKARLSITRTELENCSSEMHKFHQGEAKQCRFTLDFESLIESEIEQKRKGKEDA